MSWTFLRAGIVAMLVAFLLTAGGCITVNAFPSTEMKELTVAKSGRWFETNRVAVVDISGVLRSGDDALTLMGGTTVAQVREQLDRAAADRGVKAVVLRINSPGGEVSASDMMLRDILQFRERTGRPVVASIVDLGASGGYYVAVGADRIVASPTAITGSIGVIMQFLNIEGLFDKIGVKSQVVLSGPRKDIGSPFRPMTPEEKELLGTVNETLFRRFVDLVTASRKEMTKEDVQFISDGRILTADQALKLKMIDRIGYLEDAVNDAMALANIQSADVILYRSKDNGMANIYAALGGSPDLAQKAAALLLQHSGPRFMYLWTPGL